ncbi:MAG: HAMP domain-containing protein, partial [Oscillospiraceae bacterium]|nr:HAMP domain-containing protein [Oscillospiraceae bacterium]
MRFRTKIVLCTVLLLALSFGIGGNLLLSLSFSSVLEQEENSAFQSYEMVLSTLSLVNNVSDQTSENDVVEVLRQMEERGGDWSDLRITDQQDTLYQSDYQFTALLLDQRDATDQSTGVSQLFAYGDKHYLQITSQFLLGENTYYLDGLYDLSSPWQQRERQQGIYFSIFWGVVLLGGLLAWILATLLTRPMTQLSRASRALAEGKLDSRSQIKGSDEVADLSRDFDRMAD